MKGELEIDSIFQNYHSIDWYPEDYISMFNRNANAKEENEIEEIKKDFNDSLNKSKQITELIDKEVLKNLEKLNSFELNKYKNSLSKIKSADLDILQNSIDKLKKYNLKELYERVKNKKDILDERVFKSLESIKDLDFENFQESLDEVKEMNIPKELNTVIEIEREHFLKNYNKLVSLLISFESNNNSNLILETFKDKKEFKVFKNSKNSLIIKAGKEIAPMNISLSHLLDIKYNGKKSRYESYSSVIIKEISENSIFDKIIDNSTKVEKYYNDYLKFEDKFYNYLLENKFPKENLKRNRTFNKIELDITVEINNEIVASIEVKAYHDTRGYNFTNVLKQLSK